MDIERFKKYEPIFKTYYIKEFLGEGSFGKVFLIERDSYGMKYNAALKVISVPLSKHDLESKLSYMTEANTKSYYEDVVNGIVSEFHLMSKLKGHSHIVSYEDHDVIMNENEIGWDILIRMELLTPLPKFTDLQNIKSDDVVRLGIDICKALEKCQMEGIIHRDIKPENVFVSGDGNFKLGDFGVARTIEKTTGEFTRIGTPPYMAPEIHSGNQYASCIDIYSLGLVMYRLLNKNRMPFLPVYPEKIEPGDEEAAIARRISGDEMPPPVSADDNLAAIVLKACSFNVQNRYQKPNELREVLEEYQREKSITSDSKVENKPNLETELKSKPEPNQESEIVPVQTSDYLKNEQQIYGTTKIGSQDIDKQNYIEQGTSVLSNVIQKPPEPVKIQMQSRPVPVVEKKRIKIGNMICECGAEIRRDSISCISCKKQLRKI